MIALLTRHNPALPFSPAENVTLVEFLVFACQAIFIEGDSGPRDLFIAVPHYMRDVS